MEEKTYKGKQFVQLLQDQLSKSLQAFLTYNETKLSGMEKGGEGRGEVGREGGKERLD